MANLKRTFVQGKMNKDVDERLLPDGQYRDALNIRVSNSDGSDVGAIENSKGTQQLTNITFDEETKTIGRYVDSSNQKIYWFNTSESKDTVIEYDFLNKTTNILLEDTRGILNFSENYLITGIVKIYNEDQSKDLLVWTDDLNPPRIINIERSKSYGIDGFLEEQINLIKTPPLFPPTFEYTNDSRSSENALEDKFLAFAIRFKYKDGFHSAFSPFSYYAFSPSDLDIDYSTLENNGMKNAFNALDITFETGSDEVEEIDLLVKESNSNNVYLVETFNKNNLSIADALPYRFINDKTLSVLPEDQLFRLYDNVPNKAKALDLVGSRLVFANYEEGFDLKDSSGSNIEIDFTVEIESQDISAEDYEFTEGIQSIIRVDDLTFKNGGRLTFSLNMLEEDNNGDVIAESSYTDDLEYIINDDNIITVKDLVESEDFINFIEVVMTETFFINSNGTPPVNGTPKSSTGFSIRTADNDNTLLLLAPSTTYNIDDGSGTFIEETQKWKFSSASVLSYSEFSTLTTVKSIRNYELGLTYVDLHGRTSTILTSKTNTISVPSSLSEFKNQFRVLLNHNPPADAVAYRFAVKQTRGAHYNIFALTYYEEGNFVWVKLEGTDKDKVNVGDTLYVKADSFGIIAQEVTTTVLDIQSKETNFIEGNQFDTDTGEIVTSGGVEIIEEAGVYMKIKPNGFNLSYDANTFAEYSDIQSYDESHPAITLRLEDNNGDPIPIIEGAIITLDLSGEREREDPPINFAFSNRYVVSRDYDNFSDWFEAEVAGNGETLTTTGTRTEAIEVSTGRLDNNGGVYFYSTITGTRKRRSSHIKGTVTLRNTSFLAVFETSPVENKEALFYETSETFPIVDGYHHGNALNQGPTNNTAVSVLEWFNAYAMGDGIESVYYLDGFNNKYLSNDLRPNTVSLSGFSKVRRFADFTYSEPYIENTGFNGINEFNLSNANFKDDLDKKYGFIQKIFTRNTDIVVFQEDKVHKVLFGKDALYNADGSTNLESTNRVLGQHLAYAGEYGISRNPESFAVDANYIYFTDAKRGSVMRLAGDGLTEISKYGMKRYFKDEFKDKVDNIKSGAFDPYYDQYVLNFTSETTYIPVNLSCGGIYLDSNFSNKQTHTIDYGTQVGEAGVSFTTNGVPVKVSIEWNGNIYSIESEEGDTELQTLTFEKTLNTPTIAILTIEALDCEASINLSPICVESEQITVVSIVLNEDGDAGLQRINRYNWANDSYSSNYKTYTSLFEEGETFTVRGSGARVDIFDANTGNQGQGVFPVGGAEITMESVASPNNTLVFGTNDRMGYFVSDTQYTEADIEAIVSQTHFLELEQGFIANGERIQKSSFTVPTTNNRFVYLIWDYTAETEEPIVEINQDTKINIYFDSSGSMNSTLAPLREMASTLLKERLLLFYNNDSDLYDASVQVISHASERTIHMLNMLGDAPEGNVVCLVFQDEASNYGVGSIHTNFNAAYTQDIANFRARLEAFSPSYYRAVLFQVDYTRDTFKTFVQSIENGIVPYDNANGLGDRNEINFKYDIEDGGTAQYYLDQIVIALQELGYDL